MHSFRSSTHCSSTVISQRKTSGLGFGNKGARVGKTEGWVAQIGGRSSSRQNAHALGERRESRRRKRGCQGVQPQTSAHRACAPTQGGDSLGRAGAVIRAETGYFAREGGGPTHSDTHVATPPLARPFVHPTTHPMPPIPTHCDTRCDLPRPSPTTPCLRLGTRTGKDVGAKQALPRVIVVVALGGVNLNQVLQHPFAEAATGWRQEGLIR